MVSEINPYKQIPEYQALQRLDPSLPKAKGLIQKALKWIEKKVDSVFKSPGEILQAKEVTLRNKLAKIGQDYEKVNKRMEYLTSKLNHLPIQFNNKLLRKTTEKKTYADFTNLKDTLKKEKSEIAKELNNEIDYILSLYSFKDKIETTIEDKIEAIKAKIKIVEDEEVTVAAALIKKLGDSYVAN